MHVFVGVSRKKQQLGQLVTRLSLLQTVGLPDSPFIFGGHRAWWRVKCDYIIFLLQSSWVCLHLCACDCTTACLSVADSCVAKQPCVCTLEWGREGREAPGQQRQTLTSIATSDWTQQCSWWIRLTIIKFEKTLFKTVCMGKYWVSLVHYAQTR